MEQIGLATHNYNDTKGGLPPTMSWERGGNYTWAGEGLDGQSIRMEREF